MLNRMKNLMAAIAAVATSKEDLNEYLAFIEECLIHLVDYANCVIRQQILFPSWEYRFDGEDLLERKEQSMYERNAIHGAAVASVRIINRHCRQYNIEEMFPSIPDGPEDDDLVKDAVARAIGLFINTAYNRGIGNDPEWAAFDNAVFEKKEEYDEKKSAEILHTL